MFKKCRENQCLNRQMIDFFTRQFSLLKEVSRNCKQTSPEIVADQIAECVQLMERRIVFVLQEKPNEEFHDYLSDFYEDKLEKLRKELNKEIQKAKQLEEKTQDLAKQLRNKEDSILKTKPVDFATINENITLKNELVHSQSLIQENQIIMEEQNKALEELHAYIIKIEERQAQLRSRVELKVRELDETINAKQRQIIAFTKQFEKENKKRDKEFREIELYNVTLLEEKDRLESQIVVKSQEIKLLSKKIYDQSLVIGKFERAIDQNQGVLLEEKIENNRTIDQNKFLRERLRDIERQYEAKLDQKARQARELEARIITLTSNNKELELANSKYSSNTQKASSQLTNKIEQIRRLQAELTQLESKHKQLQKQNKKLQRKDKENSLRVQQYSQIIHEKEAEILQFKEMLTRSKKDNSTSAKLFQREKQIIKGDIETELQRLVQINTEALNSLQSKEIQLETVRKSYQQSLIKIKELNDHLERISGSFEDVKNKIGKVEEQRNDLNYVREQLEIKLKHTERRCEDLQKLQEERDSISKKSIELEEAHLHSRKLLKEKEQELEKYRRMAAEQGNRRGASDKEEARLMKEEMSKKDFQIKQMTCKIAQLQSQLRNADETSQLQKEKMQAKIQQLQQIINDRYELTTRLIDPNIL